MKRLILTVGAAIVAAVAIAACGGGTSATTTPSAGAATGTGTSAPASGGATRTVDLQQVSGVGRVLVSSAGMAMYTNDADTGGKVVCTTGSGCTSFWKPVMVSGAKPTGMGNVGKLGTIKRPEGTTQLTVNGKPVYTFVSDSPGKVTGNGFTDHFAGHKFVWHALVTGGTAAPASSSPAPTTTTSSGGGGAYGY